MSVMYSITCITSVTFIQASVQQSKYIFIPTLCLILLFHVFLQYTNEETGKSQQRQYCLKYSIVFLKKLQDCNSLVSLGQWSNVCFHFESLFLNRQTITKNTERINAMDFSKEETSVNTLHSNEKPNNQCIWYINDIS